MHYEITMDSSSNAPTPISMQCQYSQFGTSPNGQTSPSDNTAMKLGPSGYYSPQAPPHGMPGLPQAPRQKGRPRKRKPKDIEAMTASLGKLNHIHTQNPYKFPAAWSQWENWRSSHAHDNLHDHTDWHVNCNSWDTAKTRSRHKFIIFPHDSPLSP